LLEHHADALPKLVGVVREHRAAVEQDVAEFSALISAWLSSATAQATKLSKLKVFSMISAGSPGCTVPDACCDGATQATICRVFRLA
jgi:hypothetical protein